MSEQREDLYSIERRRIARSLGENPHLSRFMIKTGDPIIDLAHVLDSCRFVSDADEISMRQTKKYVPEPDFMGNVPVFEGRDPLYICLTELVPIQSLGVRHCFGVMEHLSGCRQISISRRFYEVYLPRAVPVIQRFMDGFDGFMPFEKGYVYVMESVQEGFNVVKIGKSISPDNRIKQVSPKMPFECDFRDIYPSYFMSLAEKLIHRRFAHLRTNGEWFALSPELESWMELEMAYFVKFAWIAQLKDALWQLPEVRIASIFYPRISFDPYDRGWSAIADFEQFAENEWGWQR